MVRPLHRSQSARCRPLIVPDREKNALAREARATQEKMERRMKGDVGGKGGGAGGKECSARDGGRRRGAAERGKRGVKDIGNRGIRELRTVRTVAAAADARSLSLGDQRPLDERVSWWGYRVRSRLPPRRRRRRLDIRAPPGCTVLESGLKSADIDATVV